MVKKRLTVGELMVGGIRERTTLMNPGFCRYCGKRTTHHHYYCDECYPQEYQTIVQLKTENIDLRQRVKELENNLKEAQNDGKQKGADAGA